MKESRRGGEGVGRDSKEGGMDGERWSGERREKRLKLERGDGHTCPLEEEVTTPRFDGRPRFFKGGSELIDDGPCCVAILDEVSLCELLAAALKRLGYCTKKTLAAQGGTWDTCRRGATTLSLASTRGGTRDNCLIW